jgi:hypothetical protein
MEQFWVVWALKKIVIVFTGGFSWQKRRKNHGSII